MNKKIKKDNVFKFAYKQPFLPNDLIFEMAKESGDIYSKALLLNKKEHKSFDEINKIMDKYCQEKRKYLCSQSAQASYQNFITNLKSFFVSLKDFKTNPSKFSGKPKPPRKKKFLYKIVFKKDAIRYKNEQLLLSVKKPHEPISLRWAKNLPIPIWVEISYDKFTGWSISFVMEKECIALALDKSKVMTVDLGEKRTAATFNNVNYETVTYSGKDVRSLTRLRNKVDGRIKSKKSQYKKGGRKHKKISRAGRRIVKRIRNKQNDILHKHSRMIVNDAVGKNIGRIIFGDNSSTHNKTDTGKNNQKIQQNPEQRLRKFVTYKFERVGGEAEARPEDYTSRTCPKCDHVNTSSPTGRIYICGNAKLGKCDFQFDRDGVGAIDIMKRYVSFDQNKWLDVVGGLTPPRGVKYHKNTSQLSFAFGNKSKILDGCLVSKGKGGTSSGFEDSNKFSKLEKLVEPHVL